MHILLPLLVYAMRTHAGPSSLDLPSFVRTYAIQHHFSGSILVEEDGKTMVRTSFGYANRAFNVPCLADTKFHIASITKAFTSVIVLRLAEEGKIDLHKTIETYYPSYAGPAASQVTVEELLNCTSGIENIDSNIKSVDDAIRHGIPQAQMPFSTEELVRKFCSGKLVHKPGTTFDYNDADYIILGKIVESVTGKSFDKVLHAQILDPLRMTNSGMLYQQDIVRNLASAYWASSPGSSLMNNMPIYPENWFAGGGMYSTTGDLLRFAHALYSGKLISGGSLDVMLKPGQGGFGYGVWVGYPKFGGKQYRNVNRPGRIMGSTGSFYHFNGVGFSKSINIVILSNTNLADMDGFSWAIGKALLG